MTLAVVVAAAVGVWVLGDDDDPAARRVEQLVEPADVRRGAEPGAAAEAITPEVAPPDASARADADAPVPTTPVPRRLGLEVVVRYADGSPAGHALVAVTDADESLVASGVAGRDGRLAAPDVVPAGPLDVWVAGVVHDVHIERFEAVAGPLVVDLPDGAEVTGVVRVDGAPPREEVPIAVRVRDATRLRVPGEVYVALHGDMRDRPSSRLHAGSPTVDGRFRIGGLPDGASADVRFPSLFRTVDDERSVTVQAPARDVLVDLVTRPLFIARFVDDDGAPLPRAKVDFAARGEQGAVSTVATADDEGAFAMTLPPDDGYAQVALEVVSEDDTRRGRFTFDVPMQRTTDVGDLVVPRGRVLDVLVVDEDGAPIVDALVRPLPDGVDVDELREDRGHLDEVLGVSDPTDAEGRTRVGPLRADETRAEVLALRHAAVVVPLPPPPTDALTVELTPCALFDVTFAGDGELDGVLFVVASDGALYAGGSAREHPLRRSLGAARAWRSTFRYVTDAEGSRATSVEAGFPAAPSVIISDVAPDTPLTVSVVDASDEVLWGPVEVALAPGETHAITITLEGESRTLEGRVVDTSGAPVAYAQVQIVRDGSSPNDRTEPDGTFVFDGLRVDALELFVHGDDFVARRVAVDVADSPVELVVERGTAVDVAVVDPRGRPVDGATVRFMDPESGVVRTAGGWDAASPYRLEAVPVGVYDFVVRLAGREWTARHDTRVDYLEVVVDDVGEATITWTAELDADWPWLELLRLDDETRTRRRVTDDERALRRVDFAALPHGRYTVRLTDGRPDLDRSREVLTAPPFDVGPEPARVALEPSGD